jgi:hypothetical protein
MNLSVAIQTHPLRAEMAAELAALIPGSELAVDPDPSPESPPSPWRTYRHALERTPAGATHRLIVQDDVAPCPHFLEAVEAAVAARPGRMLSFFVGGNPAEASRAVYQACDRGESWAELSNMNWCPVIALAWPAAFVAPFLAFVDAQDWPDAFRSDDEIVGRWLRHSGKLALASVPSLVEHPDVVPSLIGLRARGGEDPGRVAACLIPDDCDARTIDWTLGPGDGAPADPDAREIPDRSVASLRLT